MMAHRLALALCGATLALILVGGLVTNTGAALAVPDWPTTFGHNMFLFPWSQMVGGILYEHSHRLLGAAVGLVTIALAAVLWLSERRRWLRWLGMAAVLAVSVQGVLGGLRVVFVEDAIAIVHGSLAQAFFGLAVCLALVTSRSWATAPVQAADALRLRRLSLLTTVVAYLQIVFGAILTHFGARLDGHLAGAAALTILIPLLFVGVARGTGDRPELVRPVRALLTLLFLQIFLGVGAYAGRFTDLVLPPYIGLAFPVAHRLTGGLLLAASLVLTLRCHRLLVPPEARAPGRFLSREATA
ncbi:MAG: COX15/CtaA family protein [Candidatus Rokubacteria bacterium]|nr:COX15/CtaA family protein [Candidatus Rokubacteria bacterium]